MINEKQYQEVIRKATPMTEASFYILAALKQPLHGYGVMQKISELSRDRVQLGPGTLYGALSNLQALGLIEALGESGADRRKLYGITELGLRVAEHEINRFEELTCNGRQLLGL